MNIHLKIYDIIKFTHLIENMQVILCKGKWNECQCICGGSIEIPDVDSVCVISCRYQLYPDLNRYCLLLCRSSGIFTSTKSISCAKNELSLQTLDIKSGKSRLPCQLSASTRIGESSPRYHLSSLSVTKLLWYQKREKSESHSQCIDILCNNTLFGLRFHIKSVIKFYLWSTYFEISFY